MPLWSYSGAPFDIEDCKIAVNDGDGTYSNTTDVPSVQLLSANPQTRSGQLDGDGGITALAAKFISAQITFRFGGVSMDVLEILGAGDVQSCGTAPTRSRRVQVARNKTTYFALCGKAESAEGAGDLHLWIPKSKVMEGFELRMEVGGFVIPELTCFAIADTSVTDPNGNPVIMEAIEYETAVAVAIPPA